MTPQELLQRLRYLAEQAPIDAVLFRVPSGPACTNHHMRLDVSPRDVLDLCEWAKDMDFKLKEIAELEDRVFSPRPSISTDEFGQRY